jgi:hypothetical protein
MGQREGRGIRLSFSINYGIVPGKRVSGNSSHHSVIHAALPDISRPAASPFHRAATVVGCMRSVCPGKDVLHETNGFALIFFFLSEARSSSDSGLIVAVTAERTMRYRFRNIDGM